MHRMQRYLLPSAALALLLATCIGFISTTRTVRAAQSVAGLHVAGNQLLNSSGQVIRLVGVNRSSAEYSCISGGTTNVFDDPNNISDIPAMLSWGINAVRIPLNEDCWLGINGEPQANYTSTFYQQSVINYVNQLTADNVVVIVDLHWNNSGSNQANGQEQMPDLDHAPAFWTSVANTFKNNSSVLFDLYNEPYPSFGSTNGTGWSCWLNGASAANTAPCIGGPFAIAGMQLLVNTVRATGATNPLLLGGLAYANDLSQWLQNEPTDPLKSLIASVHIYNFNACSTTACWNTQIAPVAAKVPVIAGEIGENDCADTFINPLMSWLDQQGISYLAWSWNAFGCGSGASYLITNFNGTPSAFGAGYKAHLLSLGLGNGIPSPTPTTGTTPTPTVGTTPTPTPPLTPTPTAGITPTPTVGTTPTPTPTASPGASCSVHYAIGSQWQGGFSAGFTITNTGSTAINGWSLRFSFANGQTISQIWNGTFTQTGGAVTITSLSYNGSIPAGQAVSSEPGFNGSWTGTNAVPTAFTLNSSACTVV